MRCPKCQFENPDEKKFCRECGAKLVLACPRCAAEILSSDKFCGDCGYELNKSAEAIPPRKKEPGPIISGSPTEKITPTIIPAEGERKHVTVLFSDLTGYTTMSEKLDPEEVKEITTRIFGEVSKIVGKYDGFIEKYAGDAVMAIFGVPSAHEDDPIRAVKAAREIHELVDSVSPEVESKIGQSISMHTGINTGLVVTGEVNMGRGTHGIAGDTINTASRLSNLAKPGEILVDVNTCSQIEGHFTCGHSETTTVKGKEQPVQAHKVLSQREKPFATRRLSGVRADLVGRKVELAELSEAVENLRAGKGRIFSIYGDAGTGKSRLVEEFKATIDQEEIQWLEGHAYAYAQNIPYFPMIDLLNRVFQIKESDPVESVKEKLESGIEQLVGKKQNIIPYVGVLYSLSYQELEEVSPEFWKTHIKKAIQIILTALAKRAPTIFFLEDLHWADSSFVELLRHACLEIREPAIVLCVYRPSFNLFTSHQVSSLGNFYQEMQLEDLSRSESQEMVQLLLETEKIPSDLRGLVQGKAEGNPFYLEELINSLIESETLVQDDGNWRLAKPISEVDISSSIHGLISGRLDRLRKETKRILQEASVIGRSFLFEILKKITELDNRIDGELRVLERLDLIRTRSLLPDLEYMFKHALTQDVVYNGLLKKERQKIHEQIGLVIEQLFQDRLPEFYETLAFHFSRCPSVNKAVDYLVKSGEKCLARFTVEEAHQYFRQAYDILALKEDKSEAEKVILIDLLNSWGYAYYYTGEIKEWITLLEHHQSIVESMEDKARIGMFYTWFGCALITACKPNKAYEYLFRAKELGEQAGAKKVVGYACTFLSWACLWSGDFENGMTYGIQAQNISKSYPSDQYLYFKSLSAISYIYYFQGNPSLLFKGAKQLLEYGKKTANSRSEVFGYWINALGHLAKGELPSTRKNSELSIQAAVDPFYSQFAKTTLGMSYLIDGRLNDAENIFMSLLDHCEFRGIELLTKFADLFLSFINFSKGNMIIGMQKIEETQNILKNNNMIVWYGMSESMLGALYLKILTGAKPNMSIIFRNILFLIKNVPSADKKSEEHFKKAIEIFKQIGAKANLGQAFLGLGRLYKAKKRNIDAKKYYSKAIKLFQECEAHIYLSQAKDEAASIQ